MTVRPEGILHFRYMVSKREPWKGLAPLQVATEAAALNANVNDALKKECSGSCRQHRYRCAERWQ